MILLLRSSSRRRGVPSVGSARPSGIFFPHAVSHFERPAAHASLSLFTPLLSGSGRAMDSRADSVWTLNTPPSHFPSSVSSPRSQFASSLHDHRQNPARGPGGRIHARIRSGHRTHRPVPRRCSTCVVFMHLRHITGLFSGHSVPPADLRQQHKGYNTRTGLVPLNGFRPPSRRPHA